MSTPDPAVRALIHEVQRLHELLRDQNELARELANARDEVATVTGQHQAALDRVGELTTERDHLSVKYSELVSAVDPDNYPSYTDVPDDTISAAEQKRLLILATLHWEAHIDRMSY